MAGSVYLRRVQAINRNQQTDDVTRGMQVGQEVGKLLGGLSQAIKGQQQDALANKLMNTQNAPRAALVSPGDAPTPGGPQPGSPSDPSDADLQKAMAASSLSQPSGTPQDLGTLPSDTPMTPGPSGAQEPVPDSQASDQQLQQAMAAAQVGGGPTVGSTVPTPAPAAAAPKQNVIAPGVNTAGTTPYTGGVAGLNLVKEMQAMQLQKQQMQNAQTEAALKIADAQQKASGTGPYAIQNALNRAKLAAAQNKATPTVDLNKNPPPAQNFDSQPAINQAQVANTIDTNYGKGFTSNLSSSLMEPATIPDPNNPNGPPIPNPAAPTISGNVITLGPKNKRVTLPLAQAQIYAKQLNAQRLKQNMPFLQVPGENDQTVGKTSDNPYPAQNNLDALSRPHGSWVRLPNGKIGQVP